ncbi:DNA primase [Candidatus Babeliales bacterium]|nr:DNA primase [Candidatus Babeliales bacterium]
MSIFDFVKSKLSILDVVLDYVPLKQAGTYWKGSCPFHQETDASFTVSPDKQIFYCFGCQAGGDLIAFVAKVENVSQIEAVTLLVEKQNLEIPDSVKQEFGKIAQNSDKKDQYFQACKAAAAWMHEQLLASRVAQNYITKRNITPESTKHFKIGYMPGGMNMMNKFLKDLARQNILLKDLIDAGVVSQGRTSVYSPFEERILFPIHDGIGRCCGFGGRVFHEKDERAKYYNSRESVWFAKGTLLFGLDLAKRTMQHEEKAFLVEGYTDCVAMVQNGYKNTVATLGTACTVDHLKMLSRYIKTLYVLYDGDAAGQKAILRLTELCWQASLELSIIKLPSNQDPASFLESGGDIKKLIASASDILTFFVNSLGGQFWGKPLAEKLTLCDKMIHVVARINDRFKQDLLLQQVASVTQVPFESLKLLLARCNSRDTKHRDALHHRDAQEENKLLDSGESKESVFKNISALEQSIVAILICKLFTNDVTSDSPMLIDKDLLPYFSKPVQGILKKIEAFARNANKTSKTFDTFLDTIDDSAEKNWVIEQSFVVEDDSNQQALFESLLFRFRKRNWKQIVLDIKKRIFEAKQHNNTEELALLLSSFLNLKQTMKDRGFV